jgi:hypothetical protein
MSVKRRRLLRQRAVVVRAVMERDGGCIAAPILGTPCWGPLDPHEPDQRSHDKNAWLNAEQVVAICRGHHDWAHNHPAAAYELGLLRRGAA